AISVLLVAANRLGLTSAGTVYADPTLPIVVATLALAAAISGLESTKQYEATRRLNLGALTQINLLSQIASLGVMFTWATINRSIWALVAGNITSVVV